MNSSQLPKSLEDVQNFKCATCVDDAMNLYNCSGCNNARPAEAFGAAEVEAYGKNPNKKKMMCLPCVEQGRTIRDTALYSCCECKRALGRAKFHAQYINNFQQGRRKDIQCIQCRDLVSPT